MKPKKKSEYTITPSKEGLQVSVKKFEPDKTILITWDTIREIDEVINQGKTPEIYLPSLAKFSKSPK